MKNITTLEQLPRYAPDSWGQMVKIQPGDVWDEEPAHVYFRENDIIALLTYYRNTLQRRGMKR